MFSKNEILMRLISKINNNEDNNFVKNDNGYYYKGKKIKSVKDLYNIYGSESKEAKQVIKKLTESIAE